MTKLATLPLPIDQFYLIDPADMSLREKKYHFCIYDFSSGKPEIFYNSNESMSSEQVSEFRLRTRPYLIHQGDLYYFSLFTGVKKPWNMKDVLANGSAKIKEVTSGRIEIPELDPAYHLALLAAQNQSSASISENRENTDKIQIESSLPKTEDKPTDKEKLPGIELSNKDVESFEIDEMAPIDIENLSDHPWDLVLPEDFLFNQEYYKAIRNDDFLPLIDFISRQVSNFPTYVSETCSFAKILAPHVQGDDLTNRIATISLLTAYSIGVTRYEDLSEIYTAALLMDIGKMFTSYQFFNRPVDELGRPNKKEYNKHPLVSTFLLKKYEVNISERCKSVIEEHLERPDGSGFPKQLNKMDILSQIVGMVSNVYELSFGRLRENKMTLIQIKRLLANKVNTDDLYLFWEPRLVEAFTQVLETYQRETEKEENQDNSNE